MKPLLLIYSDLFSCQSQQLQAPHLTHLQHQHTIEDWLKKCNYDQYLDGFSNGTNHSGLTRIYQRANKKQAQYQERGSSNIPDDEESLVVTVRKQMAKN